MRIVLDSPAFINSSLFEIKRKYYTVREVLDELKDLRSKSLAETALISEKLVIREPEKSSVKRVLEKAKEIGSEEKLSETDRHVLALALDLNGMILTDDFSVQNLAAHLGIKFSGVLRGKIKEKKFFNLIL